MTQYRLTKTGEEVIARWLTSTAKMEHNHIAWFVDAEYLAADAAWRGEPVVLELGRFETKNGEPDTLFLYVDKYFTKVSDDEVS